MQLVCKSQRAASSLAKSLEAANKQWVFYSAKSCRIWHAFKSQKYMSLVYCQSKDNKDQKKGSITAYSCGKIHRVLHILIMTLFTSPNAYIASSNHLTYITHANNKSLKDASAMCGIWADVHILHSELSIWRGLSFLLGNKTNLTAYKSVAHLCWEPSKPWTPSVLIMGPLGPSALLSDALASYVVMPHKWHGCWSCN